MTARRSLVTSRSSLKSVEVAVRLQRVKEQVSGRKRGLSRHWQQSGPRGGAPRSSRRGGILLSFFYTMTQVPSRHCLQFYKPSISPAILRGPCLIRLLPASPACLSVLSAPAAVLLPPQVLCTCSFLQLENLLTLLTWLTLSPFRFQCKKKNVPQRPPLLTAPHLCFIAN